VYLQPLLRTALRRSRRAAAADFFVAPPPTIFGHRRAAAAAAAAAADFLVGAPPIRSISKSQFSAGQCYKYLDRKQFRTSALAFHAARKKSVRCPTSQNVCILSLPYFSGAIRR